MTSLRLLLSHITGPYLAVPELTDLAAPGHLAISDWNCLSIPDMSNLRVSDLVATDLTTLRTASDSSETLSE